MSSFNTSPHCSVVPTITKSDEILTALMQELQFTLQYMTLGFASVTSHFVHGGKGIVWAIQGPSKSPLVTLQYNFRPTFLGEENNNNNNNSLSPKGGLIVPSKAHEDVESKFNDNETTQNSKNNCNTPVDVCEAQYNVETVSYRSNDAFDFNSNNGPSLKIINVQSLSAMQDPEFQESFYNTADEIFVIARSEDSDYLHSQNTSSNEAILSTPSVSHVTAGLNRETTTKKVCEQEVESRATLKDVALEQKSSKLHNTEPSRVVDDIQQLCDQTCEIDEKVQLIVHDTRLVKSRLMMKSSQSESNENNEPVTYKCQACGKVFTTLLFLRAHEKSHHCEQSAKNRKEKWDDDRYGCFECGETFSQPGNLKRHERIHSGQKPYQCSICGNRFTRKDNMMQHMKMNHAKEPVRVASYKCGHCEKTFELLRHLTRHEKVHTGQGEFQCPHCGQNFTHFSNLKIHLRVHTGERSYKCLQCGNRFKELGDLKRHEKIHTGEKPHQCSICDRRFLHLWHLERHESSHSNVNTQNAEK